MCCAGSVRLCAQTDITLTDKPKVESRKADAAPEGSTLYTPAEQARYQSAVTLAYRALLHDSLSLASGYFHQAADLLPNHPSNAEIYYQLGQISLSQDRPLQAAEYFSRSLRINPHLAKSRKRLADTYLLRNDFPAAISQYSAYLNEQPADTSALLLRATAYRLTGRDSLALTDYNQVLRLNPIHPDAIMGKALILHGRGQKEQALQMITSLTTRFPTRPEYYAVRAQMEQQRANLSAALLDITRAIDLAPDRADYLLQRASIYQQQGNPALAQADRRRAELLQERK